MKNNKKAIIKVYFVWLCELFVQAFYFHIFPLLKKRFLFFLRESMVFHVDNVFSKSQSVIGPLNEATVKYISDSNPNRPSRDPHYFECFFHVIFGVNIIQNNSKN